MNDTKKHIICEPSAHAHKIFYLYYLHKTLLQMSCFGEKSDEHITSVLIHYYHYTNCMVVLDYELSFPLQILIRILPTEKHKIIIILK